MRPSRWTTLLGVAAVTLVVAWVLMRSLDRAGHAMPEVPLLVSALILAIALVVLRLGWTVRQFLLGKRPSLDPLRAAQTAVLAKASCYTGAVLIGWYGAQVLLLIGDLAIDVRRDRALAAGLAALCSALLLVVGLVVERFCRLPPPQDDDGHGVGVAAPSGAA